MNKTLNWKQIIKLKKEEVKEELSKRNISFDANSHHMTLKSLLYKTFNNKPKKTKTNKIVKKEEINTPKVVGWTYKEEKDEWYEVYSDNSRNLITVFDIPCDLTEDYDYPHIAHDTKTLRRMERERRECEREALILTRGGELPLLDSLESVLMLPPNEFKELAYKLGCNQEDEYPGEFYITVWEKYNKGKTVSQRQRDAEWKKYEEQQKGDYSTYHRAVLADDFYTLHNKEGSPYRPFTDYDWMNNRMETPVKPTQTYEQWLIKHNLNNLFYKKEEEETDYDLPF